MRAVFYESFGDNSVLQVGEQPVPKLSPGEVLIRVKSASVNPVDWKVMAGYLDPMMNSTFPIIPGWDVSGVVEKTGIDTPEYSEGDEVFAYGRKEFVHGGSFAEYLSLPASSVARKPANLSFDEAAAVPLAAMTALRCLDRIAAIAGETVLIHGGSGGVGLFAVQLAKAMGLRVIATASEKNHEHLRSLGSEPVTYGDGLIDRVLAIAPDKVDVVLDFAGGNNEVTAAVLKPAGRNASIAGDVSDIGGTSVWVRPDGVALARLANYIGNGEVLVEVAETFALDDVAKAFTASQSGHTKGKIVIHVED